jgi:Na+-driven multidrug efflux pump
VFDLGIHGAAIATILSQGFAVLYGLLFVLKRKLVPFTVPRLPKKKEVLLILHLGIPSGLQMAVISAGVAAIMSVVTSFGEGVVAGFGAAQRLDSVLMLPAQALGTAVNSMAGQNIGVNKWDRVSQIAKY